MRLLRRYRTGAVVLARPQTSELTPAVQSRHAKFSFQVPVAKVTKPKRTASHMKINAESSVNYCHE